MPALDTNILVRLLTRDDEAQARKARDLLDAHAGEDDALFVSDIVLAELAWTLDRAYNVDRAHLAQVLKALAENATLGFESREVLRQAQALYAESKAGFADCMIVAKAQSRGAVPVYTFDRAMSALSACKAP